MHVFEIKYLNLNLNLSGRIIDKPVGSRGMNVDSAWMMRRRGARVLSQCGWRFACDPLFATLSFICRADRWSLGAVIMRSTRSCRSKLCVQF